MIEKDEEEDYFHQDSNSKKNNQIDHLNDLI